MIKLILVNQTKDLNGRRLEAFFKLIVTDLLRKNVRHRRALREKKELTLVFLDHSQMKKLNFQFRRKNRPTDVLSFESTDPRSLGELLFCNDVLKTQARRQKHSFEREFQYMLIHGLLHLLGYDHELSKKEEKRMFHLQDQCFKQLNSF